MKKSDKIAVFNASGKQTGHKLIHELNWGKDLLNAANVIVYNSNCEMLLLEFKCSNQKKMWAGTCAAYLKHNESSISAARRALRNEFGIRKNPKYVDEKKVDINGSKRHWGVYTVQVDDLKLDPSISHKWVKFHQARKMVEQGKCMPAFEHAVKIIDRNR